MQLELSVEDDRWSDLERLAQRAIPAALTHCDLDPEICEISLLGCDDARIAALNADFRGKPKATNVLSWPATDLAPPQPGGQPRAPHPDFTGELALGDIAIAYETCVREAAEGGISFDDHVTHLIVHALLHLLGYDHIHDEDARLMEGVEVEILGKLGIDDPYRQ